jgi:hypothetical protein
VQAILGGTCPGRYQLACPGSYARVDQSPITEGLSRFSLTLFFQPWLVGWKQAGHVQSIVSTFDAASHTGFAAVINVEEEIEFYVGLGNGNVEVIKSGFRPVCKDWVQLAIRAEDKVFQADVAPRVEHTGQQSPKATQIRHRLRAPIKVSRGPLLFAASFAEDSTHAVERPTAFFNGRIARPTITTFDDTPVTLADWDFSIDPNSDLIHDVSGKETHGKLVNAPTRAVKSHDYDYSTVDWTRATSGYGAIHFHQDDLDDAEWATDFTITVPKDVRSGVYAVELTSRTVKDMVPFFVRPTAETAVKGAKVAIVLPTFTYLAYGNEKLWDAHRSSGYDPIPYPDFDGEHFLKSRRRPDLGASCYDVHVDGHGHVYSSGKRPLMNMRPDYVGYFYNRPQELGADIFIIALMEKEKIAYEVLTDDDIQAGGVHTLKSFDVILTGSHPEYPTWKTFSAYREYTRDGGRLMYMGGNGFYWVAGNDSDKSAWRIEIRRGHEGARTYTGEEGEHHLSTDGQMGGLWRSRGLACNRLTGVGFCGDGAFDGVPFHQTPEGEDPRYAWVFRGIEADEPIGAQGFGGPASGNEVDKFDLQNGSPNTAVVLATTLGHPEWFEIEPLEIRFPFQHPVGVRGSETREIRSDMVLLETARGGQVFSVGSINWYNAMVWNNFDNSAAKVTLNVLRHFLDQASMSCGVASLSRS